MMAYGALAYCLRGCTYTIMGDISRISISGMDSMTGRSWKLLLTGPYDSFQVLKKSYRNTVEISRFATEILRHGNFPGYPVEPVRRHGKEVSMVACKGEKEQIEKTVKILKNGRKKAVKP